MDNFVANGVSLKQPPPVEHFLEDHHLQKSNWGMNSHSNLSHGHSVRHLLHPPHSPKPKSSVQGTPKKGIHKGEEVGMIDNFDHMQYEIPYEKHEVTETEKFLRDKKDRQAKARENEAKMERDRLQREQE